VEPTKSEPSRFRPGIAPSGPVLLTGATGFVGGRLLARLEAEGVDVRCAARDPARAASPAPGRSWVRLDVNDRATLGPALSGVRAVVYLVHAMGRGSDYERTEREAARWVAEEAARAGVERVVYLGGVAPSGRPSPHLRSRLATGEILRRGTVPVFELRAAMIVGHGSISWRIVRDLAARLPAMLLPRWLSTRSRPIGIDDVVFALATALTCPVGRSGVYELPGPEILSAKDILMRIAHLRGTRPMTLSVPILTPRLSSYWLKLVTAADYDVARELVEGLRSDLLPTGPTFWDLVPDHELVSFDEAARRALADDQENLPPAVALAEKRISQLSRRTRP
jgi:uncharacterized protein YbjT (DUF2867 family)